MSLSIAAMVFLVGGILWATYAWASAEDDQWWDQYHKDLANRCKTLNAEVLDDEISHACVRDGKVIWEDR